MNNTLESVARAQEQVARSLHRRKPMWPRTDFSWIKWVVIVILMASVWAMNLAHADVALGSSAATQFKTDFTPIPAGTPIIYQWLDSPCGSTQVERVIAISSVPQITVWLTPGCHAIRTAAIARGLLAVAYPVHQVIVLPAKPGKPTNLRGK